MMCAPSLGVVQTMGVETQRVGETFSVALLRTVLRKTIYYSLLLLGFFIDYPIATLFFAARCYKRLSTCETHTHM